MAAIHGKDTRPEMIVRRLLERTLRMFASAPKTLKYYNADEEGRIWMTTYAINFY